MIFDHDSTRQSTPETVTTSPRMVTGTVHTPLIPAPRPAAGTPRSQISELVRTSSGVCRSFRTSGDDRDREQNYHFTGARSPDADQREAAMRRNPRKFANSRRKNRNFAITDLLIHLCARSDALTTHISSTASDHNRAAIDRDRHDHDVHTTCAKPGTRTRSNTYKDCGIAQSAIAELAVLAATAATARLMHVGHCRRSSRGDDGECKSACEEQ